jgi:CRP/FNR family transcriptional regulator, cyclic AMP receptor protein
MPALALSGGFHGGQGELKYSAARFIRLCPQPAPMGVDDRPANRHVPFRLSRNHFMIEERDGNYWVRDLYSTLGTIVNGEPIGEHFRSDEAPLRAGENEVIAGGVD